MDAVSQRHLPTRNLTQRHQVRVVKGSMHELPARIGFPAWTTAAVRSMAAYVFISLYILVVGPPALLVAWVTRSPRVLYTLGIAAVRLGLFIAGIRYAVSGAEHI